jgi:hypothetical protein
VSLHPDGPRQARPAPPPAVVRRDPDVAGQAVPSPASPPPVSGPFLALPEPPHGTAAAPAAPAAAPAVLRAEAPRPARPEVPVAAMRRDGAATGLAARPADYLPPAAGAGPPVPGSAPADALAAAAAGSPAVSAPPDPARTGAPARDDAAPVEASGPPTAAPPAAPIAAAPGLSGPPMSLAAPDWAATLARTVAGALLPGGGVLVLELAPATLGPLRVEVAVTGGEAAVSIVAGTPEAARQIAAAAPDLAAALQAQGLTLGGQQGTGQPPPGDGRQGGGNGASADARPVPARGAAAPPLPAEGARLVNLIA